MAIASGASRGLAYGVQSARGSAASATTLLRTAGSGQSFTNNRNRLDPASIREDGQPTKGASGTYNTTATVPFNFATTEYNPFIAAALRQKVSAWTTPFDLIFGTDLIYWTLEDRFKDITQYVKYIDMVLNTLKITATQSDNGAYVTGELGFMGTSRTISGTPIATPAAAGTSDPITTCGGVVSVGGSPIATVTSFDFTIDNGMKAIYALGTCAAYDVVKGPIKVNGNLSVFFEDATYITDVDNQTNLDLTLVLSDGTNTNTFDFPQCNLTSESLSGGTAELTLAMPFEASYDATDTTTVTASHSA